MKTKQRPLQKVVREIEIQDLTVEEIIEALIENTANTTKGNISKDIFKCNKEKVTILSSKLNDFLAKKENLTVKKRIGFLKTFQTQYFFAKYEHEKEQVNTQINRLSPLITPLNSNKRECKALLYIKNKWLKQVKAHYETYKPESIRNKINLIDEKKEDFSNIIKSMQKDVINLAENEQTKALTENLCISARNLLINVIMNLVTLAVVTLALTKYIGNEISNPLYLAPFAALLTLTADVVIQLATERSLLNNFHSFFGFKKTKAEKTKNELDETIYNIRESLAY